MNAIRHMTGEAPMLPADARLWAMQPYTFSDDAACLVQHDADRLQIVHASAEDAIDGVWCGIDGGDYGIIPFENSSKGPVWDHVDHLLDGNYHIIGEVNFHVHMCMGSKREGAITTADRVFSHPMGLAQSSQFLDRMGIPNDAEHRVPAKTTVGGAEELLRSGTINDVCLGSRRALLHHGLHINHESIANLEGAKNITQFFVVQRNGQHTLPNVDNPYHAVLLEPDTERIGALHDILGIMHHARADLISLHSQRQKDGYRFLLKMDVGEDPTAMQILQRDMETYPHLKSVKWIGSWSRRLYSDTIGMGPSEYRTATAPKISGDRLDLSQQFHGIEFKLDNHPGALYGVTGKIRHAGVNLNHVQSRTEGHQEYSFLLGMNSGVTSRERMQVLLDKLEHDHSIESIVWRGSHTSREQLLQALIGDSKA